MLWQPLNLTEACPADSHITACTPFGYIYLNLLVRLYGDSKDRRIQEKLRREREEEEDGIVESISDYEEKRDREEYDFIIVGAGSAGCVVANRLSANKKWKVLLLEAGIEQPDVTLVPGLSTALLGSNIDWSYQTEPDGKSCLARPGGRCTWPRGKVMGGSSSINSMVYVRGNRLDYDGWAALGNEGWSYKDVLPFFKKYEKNLNYEGLNRKYHGVDGEMSISRYPYIDKPSMMMVDAYNEVGLPFIDFNAKYQVTGVYAQSFSVDGERMSTNYAFIQPVRYKRKNLTVKVKSEAVQILIDDNKVAYGVKYIKNEKVQTAIAKKEVIISSGSINSPKLLMLSGVGPKEHLSGLNIEVKQDLAVGENLHDHGALEGFQIALSNKTSTLIEPEEILEELYHYSLMKTKHGPLSAHSPTSAITFIKTDPDLPAPDVQIHVLNIELKGYTSPADVVPIMPTSFYDALTPLVINLTPKSRGRLLLNATHPHSSPLLYPNYFGDPSDLIPIVNGSRFLLSLENTEVFRTRGAHFVRRRMPACKQYPWGTDEYIVCLAKSYTFTVYHPVGTCKMGPKRDHTAVVDPRLRVYGISGLRVIDASIMPVIVRGNTNAPTIMIGERGASFILEDWLKESY